LPVLSASHKLRRGVVRRDGLGSTVSISRRTHLTLLIFCFYFLVGSLQVYPQTEKAAASVKPSVLIVSLPVQGKRDEGVRKVLASAMRFELEQSGLQTLLVASTDEESLVADLLGEKAGDSAALARSLLEFFSSANQDFLILGGYIKEKEEIQVDFYFADLERGEIVASASKRAVIDFTLDEAMIRALRGMLPRAEERIGEVAERLTEEAAKQAEQQQEVEEAVVESEAVEGQEVTIEPLPEVPPAIPVKAVEERFRPFEFSLGFAPFIPVGSVNTALALSYMPFLYADYRIALRPGVLGLGLFTGLNVFDSDEPEMASYFRYIVPVGVDARFTTPDDVALGLFVRASVGTALNVSDFSKLPEDQRDDLSRVMAYACGGIGAMYTFTPSVGIAVDVLYETFVYFWKHKSGGGINTDWIMGFIPSIYLYTRL
jgi:hypothetical protein